MKTKRNRNKGIALVRAQAAAVAVRLNEAQGIVASLGEQLVGLNKLEAEMVQVYARKVVRKPAAARVKTAQVNQVLAPKGDGTAEWQEPTVRTTS